jgi:RNA polymerase sigma factor (sigma-70 family)
VLAARTGDRAAFAALYDRYADRVFALCVTLTRDRGVAEDALSETFLLAWQRLGQLREPDRVRPWLFAIARNRVARLGAKASRSEPVDPMGGDLESGAVVTSGDVAADVASGLDASTELALVWEAAAGLNEAERAALELSVRQGLEGDELAAALGMTRHHVNVTVGRMRQNLERSVGALRLLRTDDGSCPTFTALLDGYSGALTPLWRKRIARHADGCAVCDDRRRAPRAIAAFRSSTAHAAPASVRDSVLGALPVDAAGLPVPDRSAFRAGRDGFPRVGRRFRPLVVAAVAVVAVLVVVLGFPGMVGDGRLRFGERSAEVVVPRSAAGDEGDASGGTTVGAVSPGGTTTSSSAGSTSAAAPGSTTSSEPSVARSGTGTGSSTTRGDTLPPKIVSVQLAHTTIRAASTGCPVTSRPTSTTLTITVSDDVGVVAGDVEVSVDGATWRSLVVTVQAGKLVGTVGPSKYAGSIRVRVNGVEDAAGNRSAPWGSTLQVKVAC